MYTRYQGPSANGPLKLDPPSKNKKKQQTDEAKIMNEAASSVGREIYLRTN